MSARRWVSPVILIVMMIAFFTPLASAAAFGFSLPGQGFTLQPLLDGIGDRSFLPQVMASIMLALLSAFGSLLLLVPTMLLLHMRLPKLLPYAETFTMIAFVIPPVALVSGVSITFRALAPSFMISVLSLVPFYIVLSMPLVYRALDAGIRAIDVGTLMAAGRSLGASTARVVLQIIVPNLTPALISGGLLCATMAIGEYTFASLLLHNTFPVFLEQIGNQSIRPAAALSVLTLLATWALMASLTAVADRLGRRRGARGTSSDDTVISQTLPRLEATT